MDRQELLDKLSAIKPALAETDQVPILCAYWFYGMSVLAFNSRIGMSKPCKTEFTGAVPGITMLSLLASSGTKEVKIDPNSGNSSIVMKLGGAKITLAMLPITDEPFKMPKPDSKFSLKVDMEDFLDGVDNCMKSISDDAVDNAGMFLVPEDNGLTLYTSDRKSVSYARISQNPELKKRAILSHDFCKQMLALSKEGSPSLEIHDTHALFTTKESSLWGKLLNPEQEVDFSGIRAKFFPKETQKALIEIPPSLKYALERAMVILSDKSSTGLSEVSIERGVLTMLTESALGKVNDVIKLDNDDLKVRIDPKAVHGGCEAFDHMAMTKRAVIMTRKKKDAKAFDRVYMVANKSA